MFVSCAFDDLYGEGDLFAHAPDRSGLAPVLTHDAAGYGIHKIAAVFQRSAYTWPEIRETFLQNDAFVDQLVLLFEEIKHRQVSPSLLVHVDHAYFRDFQVVGGPAEASALLYETYRVPDRVATPPLETPVLVDADAASFVDPAVGYLLLAGSGSFNYGHWLVDDLPKIRGALDLLARSGRPVCLLLAAYGGVIDQVRADSIRYMTGDDRISIRFFDRERVHLVRNLHVVTPVTCHPTDKSVPAMRYIQQLARQRERFARARSAAGAKRLFVARAGGGTRALVNEDEVWAALSRHGFTMVDPGSLTFAEQVSAFAGAEVVIGTMGAAMTNTLFCAPGTRIGYLGPRGWVETFYIDLAATCRHRYRAIYGDLQEAAQPPHLSPFSISSDDLALLLADLERN